MAPKWPLILAQDGQHSLGPLSRKEPREDTPYKQSRKPKELHPASTRGPERKKSPPENESLTSPNYYLGVYFVIKASYSVRGESHLPLLINTQGAHI